MKNNANALICIDIQNDFCPKGALAVTEGDQILDKVNHKIETARATGAAIIMTQDWHPSGHKSFASNHEGKAPFDVIEMDYGPQVLWPDHCVQGTNGAEFHEKLNVTAANLVIRKGFREAIDSYSAFFENDKTTSTGLHGYLQNRHITALTMVGLATDFCVAYSALDAAQLGYDVTVDLSGCRAIDLDGSLALQLEAMRGAGVKLIDG